MICWNSLFPEFLPCQFFKYIFYEMENNGSFSFAVPWVRYLVYEESRDGAVFAFFFPFIPWLYFDGLLTGFTHGGRFRFLT